MFDKAVEPRMDPLRVRLGSFLLVIVIFIYAAVWIVSTLFPWLPEMGYPFDFTFCS